MRVREIIKIHCSSVQIVNGGLDKGKQIRSDRYLLITCGHTAA